MSCQPTIAHGPCRACTARCPSRTPHVSRRHRHSHRGLRAEVVTFGDALDPISTAGLGGQLLPKDRSGATDTQPIIYTITFPSPSVPRWLAETTHHRLGQPRAAAQSHLRLQWSAHRGNREAPPGRARRGEGTGNPRRVSRGAVARVNETLFPSRTYRRAAEEPATDR
jgi:hypothetical protein